jgi:hypothetical protein
LFGFRSLQGDRHGADDVVASAPALHWTQQDTNVFDFVGLRELRQRSEHSVLSIRPRLLADRGFSDYFNAHRWALLLPSLPSLVVANSSGSELHPTCEGNA